MQLESEKLTQVVSVLDPAIDLEAMDIKIFGKYSEEREVESLKFKPAHKPAVFHLRRARGAEWAWVMEAQENTFEQRRRAFSVCCMTAKDVESDVDGRFLSQLSISRQGNISAWKDSDLEHIPTAYIDDIGGYAYQRSFLPRGSRAQYLPPRSVSLALRTILASSLRARSAAQSQSGAETESNDDTSSSQTQTADD